LQLFFDQLRLDQTYTGDSDYNDALGNIVFKDAMEVFDFGDRWMYLGCSTLPPCKKFFIWHQIRKVYPMELK